MGFNPATLFRSSYSAPTTAVGQAAIANALSPRATTTAPATPTPVNISNSVVPAVNEDAKAAVKVLAGAYAGSPTSSRLGDSGSGILSSNKPKGRRSQFLGV